MPVTPEPPNLITVPYVSVFFFLFSPPSSFAYLTVRDRLPTILTKVIDTIHRNKNNFFEKHGEVKTRKAYTYIMWNTEQCG